MSETTTSTATEEQHLPRLIIKGQYVKDLSFENPKAPHGLVNMKAPPQMNVQVNLKANKLQEKHYELALLLSAKASTDKEGKDVLFLIELAYAGIFMLENIPPEHLEQVVMTDCPFMLFPFARRVIADVTRDGGLPPLMLDPVDFHAMYQHKKQSARQFGES